MCISFCHLVILEIKAIIDMHLIAFTRILPHYGKTNRGSCLKLYFAQPLILIT